MMPAHRANSEHRELASCFAIFCGASVMALLLASHFLRIELPCGQANQCEILQSTELSMLAGMPVALPGIIVFVLLAALRFVPGSAQVRNLVGAFSSLFAVSLQVKTFQSIHFVCGWCVVASAMLVTSTLTGWSLDTRFSSRKLLVGFIGAMCPIAVIPAIPGAYTRSHPKFVERTLLLPNASGNRAYVVLVGSPTCQACVDEAKALVADPSTSTRELKFILARRTDSSAEVILGARMKAAVAAKDLRALQLFQPAMPIQDQLISTASMGRGAQQPRFTEECRTDATIVARLHIQSIPITFHCSGDEQCVSP